MMAYRNAVHSTTHETPHFMMFGREMTLPVDVMFGGPREEEIEVQEYTDELKSRLQNLESTLRVNMRDRKRLMINANMGNLSRQEILYGFITQDIRRALQRS